MTRDIDPVRWFESLGKCSCGKPAVGTLRGPHNESYGRACQKCADRRIKAARAAFDADNSIQLAGSAGRKTDQ